MLEKQGKALEHLQGTISNVQGTVAALQTGQEKTNTILAQRTIALQAIGAGHQDLGEQVKTLQKTVATAKDVDCF